MSGGGEPGARFLFGDYHIEPTLQFGLDRGVWSVVLHGILQIAPVIAELIVGERVKRVFRLVDRQWFAALWRRASTVPAVSAGTHPGPAIDPGAIAAAGRHRLPLHLPLRRLRPRHIGDMRHDGDLVITVCDPAHEELAETGTVHWSVPDPVPAGDPGSFDAALAQLADRVGRLAPHLAAVS